MVPPSKYGQISAIASAGMALAVILGPLIGGAINETGSWRWVFLLKYMDSSYHKRLYSH
jgi:predicted MFS family arabinose efflux permease